MLVLRKAPSMVLLFRILASSNWNGPWLAQAGLNKWKAVGWFTELVGGLEKQGWGGWEGIREGRRLEPQPQSLSGDHLVRILLMPSWYWTHCSCSDDHWTQPWPCQCPCPVEWLLCCWASYLFFLHHLLYIKISRWELQICQDLIRCWGLTVELGVGGGVLPFGFSSGRWALSLTRLTWLRISQIKEGLEMLSS